MRGILLAQEQIFSQKFLLLCGAIEEQLQVIEIHGLLDEIKRALFHRRNCFVDGSVGRH